jgi:hypothetical protein
MEESSESNTSGGRGRGRGKSNWDSGSSYKKSEVPKKKITKYNHIINIFIYTNIALIKGDTYPYRGIFRRNGGNFSKQHYGYLVPLSSLNDVKYQVGKFVESMLVYHRYEQLDIPVAQNMVIDDDNKDYESPEESQLNSSNVLDL